jgi:hypothetical protein
MYFDIFLFSFPSFPSSIEQFHCYKHVLYINLHIIMFVFVHMFIFWICLPCMRENMALVFFFLVIHLFTCAYIVWAISPSCPDPHPLPPTLVFLSLGYFT